jgi:hypothetical protein
MNQAQEQFLFRSWMDRLDTREQRRVHRILSAHPKLTHVLQRSVALKWELGNGNRDAHIVLEELVAFEQAAIESLNEPDDHETTS